MKKARDQGLDLVQMDQDGQKSICKILDWGKHKFSRKKTTVKRKNTTVQVKEVKFRPQTEAEDYSNKLRNVKKFLSDGDRVRVIVRFRGREVYVMGELGEEILNKVVNDVGELAKVEQKNTMEGRQMIMLLSPTASVLTEIRKKEKQVQSVLDEVQESVETAEGKTGRLKLVKFRVGDEGIFQGKIDRVVDLVSLGQNVRINVQTKGKKTDSIDDELMKIAEKLGDTYKVQNLDTRSAGQRFALVSKNT